MRLRRARDGCRCRRWIRPTWRGVKRKSASLARTPFAGPKRWHMARVFPWRTRGSAPLAGIFRANRRLIQWSPLCSKTGRITSTSFSRNVTTEFTAAQRERVARRRLADGNDFAPNSKIDCCHRANHWTANASAGGGIGQRDVKRGGVGPEHCPRGVEPALGWLDGSALSHPVLHEPHGLGEPVDQPYRWRVGRRRPGRSAISAPLLPRSAVGFEPHGGAGCIRPLDRFRVQLEGTAPVPNVVQAIEDFRQWIGLTSNFFGGMTDFLDWDAPRLERYVRFMFPTCVHFWRASISLSPLHAGVPSAHPLNATASVASQLDRNATIANWVPLPTRQPDGLSSGYRRP